MKIYVVGTAIELNAKIEDLDGNTADPDFMRATIIDATGATLDVTALLKRRDVGDYFILYIPPVSGLYQYRVAGYGPSINGGAANEGTFYAETSFAYALILTPATAALALDSQNAFIVPTLSVFIMPDAGQIDAVGYIPGTGNPVVVPDTGAVYAQGQPGPSMSVAQGSQPIAAALQLQGLAPTLQMNILTQTGSLAMIGIAPSTGGAVLVNPSTGAMQLQGNTPNLNGKQQITPNTGTLVIVGATPTEQEVITGTVGAMALTGFAPVLGAITAIAPNAGAVNFTGLAPVPTRITVIAPLVAALAATGVAPAVAIGSPRAVNAGSLALTGIAPVVNFSQSIVTNTGAMAATGAQAQVGVYIRIAAAASLALTGIAPTLLRGTLMTPTVAGLALTPIAAAVTRIFRLTPNTGALAIVGNTASGGPTFTITDNFVRADAATLGANWTDIDAGWEIVSNQALQTPGGSSITSARYTATALPNDQVAEFTPQAISLNSDSGAGPGVRFTAGGDLVFVQGGAVETRLYKRVSGSYTQLGTDGPACSANDVLFIQIVGSTITVKRNGTTICGTPVAMGTGPSAGSAGIWGAEDGGIRPSGSLFRAGTP